MNAWSVFWHTHSFGFQALSFSSWKESQCAFACCAVNGYFWNAVNSYIGDFPVKGLPGLYSHIGLVDECWPRFAHFCALVGDDYSVGLVDDHGVYSGGLSPALRK